MTDTDLFLQATSLQRQKVTLEQPVSGGFLKIQQQCQHQSQRYGRALAECINHSNNTHTHVHTDIHEALSVCLFLSGWVSQKEQCFH